MRLPQLTADQQKLLAVTYQGFSESGTWPTMSYVDVVLDQDHEVDIEPVLFAMPPGILRHGPNFATEHATIELTVAGLYGVAAAKQDLSRFVELVRACADREQHGRPGPAEVARYHLTQDDAPSIWRETATTAEAARAFALFRVEGLYSQLSGPDADGNWSITFDRNVRAYRDIATVHDYLARRPEPPSHQWTPPPPIEPYIFILMPFGESWSLNVEDTINQACTGVARGFAGLRAERADDITETGRITDQIMSAIERADVLVADITGATRTFYSSLVTATV